MPSDTGRNLIRKARWLIPLQFKSMNLVIWPIGDPDYESAHPDCTLEQMEIHICPSRERLDSLTIGNAFHISDDDWVQGHFDSKFEVGQLAICGFSEGHLAHVIWAAVGAEAGRKLVWDPPLKLDWSRSSVLSGAYTPATFRGQGAYPFIVTEGLRYLRSLGLAKAYTAFHWKNTASRRGLQKANALLAATCWRMRLRFPGRGVRYIPLLAYGRKPDSDSRWYRRQFTDQLDIMPEPIV